MAVEAAAMAAWRWQPAWWRRQQLGKSAIWAAAAAHWEARWQRVGGGSNAELAAAARRMLTMTATVMMMTMIDH